MKTNKILWPYPVSPTWPIVFGFQVLWDWSFFQCFYHECHDGSNGSLFDSVWQWNLVIWEHANCIRSQNLMQTPPTMLQHMREVIYSKSLSGRECKQESKHIGYDRWISCNVKQEHQGTRMSISSRAKVYYIIRIWKLKLKLKLMLKWMFNSTWYMLLWRDLGRLACIYVKTTNPELSVICPSMYMEKVQRAKCP